MTAWLLRRLAATLAIAAAVVTLVFFAVRAAPGTPFLPPDGRRLDPAVEASLIRRFGLDRPLPAQYAAYVGRLVQGDLGESFSQRRPVRAAMADALPNTLLLALAALILDFGLGTILGIIMALRAGGRADSALGAGLLVVYSLPTFWLGLVLLLVFGQWLHWLPVGGATDPVLYDGLPLAGRIVDRLRHLALPALALGLVGAAGTALYQRGALLDALRQDFVRTAHAKGLSPRRVLLRHAWRNALLPSVTLLGIALPFVLTGSVVVETVFAWPGLGKLTADALLARDYPLVVGASLVAALLVALGSLLADAAYALLDPRLRRPA